MLDTMRSYKFRIYPTKEQSGRLVTTFARHRQLYNAALEQRNTAWKDKRLIPLASILRRNALADDQTRRKLKILDRIADCWRQLLPRERGIPMSYKGDKERGIQCQSAEVKIVKRMDDYATINSASLGLTLMRLQKAYQAFFKRGGFPKFKSPRTFRSIGWQVGNGCKIGERLYLHGVGEVKVRWHRPLPESARPKQVTVRLNPSGRWYVCIQAEVTIPTPEPHPGPEVALDLGINQLAVFADGLFIQARKHLGGMLRKLRVQQRTMARRRPGPGQPASKGYREAQQQVAKTHEHIANARQDFNHKLTRDLVRQFGRIGIEKLDIAAMVSDKDGLPHLNRDVLDVAWGQIRMFLGYKAEETGTQLVAVNPAYTTQDCSACGHRVPNTGNRKQFKCPECGWSAPRKVNAAKNVQRKSSRRSGDASGEVVV